MGRKQLSAYKINKIKKLLFKNYTSKEIAAELKISTATVSNYRSYFKKKGELNTVNSNDAFPRSFKQNTLKKSSSLKVSKTLNSYSASYKYIVNGITINFKQKPKSIIIGKNELVIEI